MQSMRSSTPQGALLDILDNLKLAREFTVGLD